MKKSYVTVTDQFCGAGGSSEGATHAGAPIPGPSGKYGWAWRLPAPQWTWQDLTGIAPRTMRLF